MQISVVGQGASLYSVQQLAAQQGQSQAQNLDPDGDGDVDGPGPDTNDSNGKGQFINMKA